jgi:hypothetical protein
MRKRLPTSSGATSCIWRPGIRRVRPASWSRSSGRPLLERLGFASEGLAKDYLFIDGAWRDHVLTARLNPAFDTSIFSSRRFRPA